MGEICPSCDADDSKLKPGGSIGPFAIAALIAGVIPFFFHIRSSSTTMIDGVTSSRVTDYIALGCGGLALILGVIVLVKVLRAGGVNVLKFAPVATMLGLGTVQLLRGFGMF